MNRQQGKCVLGSACLHGLLCLVLVVGPALMTRKVEDSPSVITLINANITDGPSGGGAAEPLAQSPADPPAPKPVPVPQPEVVKPTPEIPKPQPEIKSVEPKPVEPVAPKVVESPKVEEIHKAPDGEMKLTPTQKKKVDPPKTVVKESSKRPLTTQKVETKPIVKSSPKVDLSKTVKRDTKAVEDAQAKADAEREGQRRQQIASVLGKGSSIIKSKTSAPTTVEATGGGDGTGGQASINYRQYVAARYKSEFDDAVAKAAGISAGEMVVRASVTINSNGRVIASEIIAKSGNREMDRLVQRVLDGVKQVEGFPKGSQDSERKFTLRFQLDPESRQG